MTTAPEGPQIPQSGPLSYLDEHGSSYGESQYLEYGGTRHLRRAFRLPIQHLHFNIENGRYATKFQRLKAANPGVNINPSEPHWRDEILKMLDGTWEDPTTGLNTRNERSHFQSLIKDIKRRGQERTGIVLEDGGVLSGNRRLAALLTLSKQQPDVDRYRYLHAFLIPVQDVSPSDRWRLEMSAQMGQGRLMRDYDAVERLIKIREGVDILKEAHSDSEEAAIQVIASDFGTDPKTIRDELDTLKHIKNYLDAIDRPDEYWLANDLTEVFTEWEPLERSMNVNDMPLRNRKKLRDGVRFMIRNDVVDFRLLRDIRGAVGPARRRRNARAVPRAIEAITANAPDQQALEGEPNDQAQGLASHIVEQFRAEYQAGRPGSVLAKAQSGAANLRAVKEALERDPAVSTGEADDLRESLGSARDYAVESLNII